MKKHFLFTKSIAGIFWISLILVFFCYQQSSGLSALEMVNKLYQLLSETVYGPLIYILLYIIRPLIFFPGSLLTLLGGGLFGFSSGVFYTIIAANASANFAYWVGRFFGEGIISRKNPLFKKVLSLIDSNSFESVLIMRFAFLPFDFVNYACGILNINWMSYALASFLGMIVGSAFFVSIGASIDFKGEGLGSNNFSLDTQQLLISLVLFISSFILARFFRWYSSNKSR